jgi:type IV fimbrial biogenesis protein FimU
MKASLPDSGFTLVELMVVLLLITLFSTLIMPSVVTAMREDALSTQRDKVAELLRFASLTAITRHHPVQVYVDSDKGLCRVVLSQTALPWLDEEQRSSQVLASLRLPEKMHVELARTEENDATGDPTSVTFLSDGRADGTRLTLTSAKGERGIVEVIATTGEVLLRDEEE